MLWITTEMKAQVFSNSVLCAGLSAVAESTPAVEVCPGVLSSESLGTREEILEQLLKKSYTEGETLPPAFL